MQTHCTKYRARSHALVVNDCNADHILKTYQCPDLASKNCFDVLDEFGEIWTILFDTGATSSFKSSKQTRESFSFKLQSDTIVDLFQVNAPLSSLDRLRSNVLVLGFPVVSKLGINIIFFPTHHIGIEFIDYDDVN